MGDVGAFLRNVLAQHDFERFLQQVSGSMVLCSDFTVVGEAALKNLLASGAGKFLMFLVRLLKLGAVDR